MFDMVLYGMRTLLGTGAPAWALRRAGGGIRLGWGGGGGRSWLGAAPDLCRIYLAHWLTVIGLVGGGGYLTYKQWVINQSRGDRHICLWLIYQKSASQKIPLHVLTKLSVGSMVFLFKAVLKCFTFFTDDSSPFESTYGKNDREYSKYKPHQDDVSV
jgi:hypothetical protein